jgi:hypothetical protein
LKSVLMEPGDTMLTRMLYWSSSSATEEVRLQLST